MRVLSVVFLATCNIGFQGLIVVVIISALACDSDEWQLRVEKKTKAFASEESYKILHGNQVMATSDAFTDNAIRNFYHCIKKFDDGVYTLVMNDRYFFIYYSGE